MWITGKENITVAINSVIFVSDFLVLRSMSPSDSESVSKRSKLIVIDYNTKICLSSLHSYFYVLNTQNQKLKQKNTSFTHFPPKKNPSLTEIITPKHNPYKGNWEVKHILPFVPYPAYYGVIHLFKTHSWVRVKSVMNQGGDIMSMLSSPQTMTAFKLPAEKKKTKPPKHISGE